MTMLFVIRSVIALIEIVTHLLLFFCCLPGFGLMFRSALLFREVRRRMGTDVPVTIGSPLKLKDFEENISNQELVKTLRTLTYSLDPNLPEDPPFGMDL